MKSLSQISEAELEVMKIVWKGAHISTNEVTKHLTRTTEWCTKALQVSSYVQNSCLVC